MKAKNKSNQQRLAAEKLRSSQFANVICHVGVHLGSSVIHNDRL